MDYIYRTIYQFEGISDSNLVKDKIVFQNEVLGITVLLTKDINLHCSDIDKGLACGILIFRGMLADEKLQELPEAIEVEVKKIKEARMANKKSGAYAVITIKGNVELNINENLHKETNQFHICFDAIDKDSLRDQHKEKVHSIISSLSMCTGPEYHAERISSGIHFIDDNGKLLYNFTMRESRVRIILSKPINIETENEITKIIGLSTSNQQFKTPFRLFTQSLETTQDELRSFISAWSAIEIFTNKVFSIYEDKFISNIADDHDSHGVNQFLIHIKDVMKDKYRLTDKFSLIASFLSDEIEKDIKLFKSMKNLRDDISHGKEFNEESLPVEDARKLAAKYLKDHMILTASA
jgi:hypothetical protein